MDAFEADLSMPRANWRAAYRLRIRRKKLLWRAFRARHQLTEVRVPEHAFPENAVVAVVVLRNERSRLPYFLQYYRALGISHFLVIDNGSTDGSDAFLLEQADVSLWQTDQSYHASRFGLDWSSWLLRKYCHGRWCLTVDVDELLVFDGMENHNILRLAARLDQQGIRGFGAMMLDLYPNGPLADQHYEPAQNPLEVTNWFDPAGYRAVRQDPLGNLWLQGGARERVFFPNSPHRSPTLNKIPLVKWDRSFAYVNSTHSLLPRHLNGLYSGPGNQQPSGVLLHTKFLPEIVSKSETEKKRQQHFHDPKAFDQYYDDIIASPNLWCEESVKYQDAAQLVELGLMSPISWLPDIQQTNSPNL